MKRFVLRGAVVLVVVSALAAAFAQASPAAPWCGSPSVQDRAPAVAGPTIRVLYMIPSDGADRTAELAPRISADVDEIAAWWLTQDAEREPRFDRASFPCGPQADILTLRLTDSAAAISPGAVRFERIANAAGAATGSLGYQKHLVYYDGPTDNGRICGEGGGTADGPGIAVVYLSSCPGVPTAPVAAHELLHAFGALPASGPPNACPDTRAHPCDSDMDILYPFADTTPLGSRLLDFGRNDYYAHSGAWLDVQDSPWLPCHAPGASHRRDRRDGRRGERHPRRRLHGELHHRVGRGNDRLARGARRGGTAIRALVGGLHGHARVCRDALGGHLGRRAVRA